jgi:septal ring factor EnvC (AmiA/AmiB activator)
LYFPKLSTELSTAISRLEVITLVVSCECFRPVICGYVCQESEYKCRTLEQKQKHLATELEESDKRLSQSKTRIVDLQDKLDGQEIELNSAKSRVRSLTEEKSENEFHIQKLEAKLLELREEV